MENSSTLLSKGTGVWGNHIIERPIREHLIDKSLGLLTREGDVTITSRWGEEHVLCYSNLHNLLSYFRDGYGLQIGHSGSGCLPESFFCAEESAIHHEGQRPVDTESPLELGQMACDTTGETLQNSIGRFRDGKQACSHHVHGIDICVTATAIVIKVHKPTFLLSTHFSILFFSEKFTKKTLKKHMKIY